MNKKRAMEEEKEELGEKKLNPNSHLYLETKNKNIISKQKSNTIQFYLIIIVIFFLIYYLFFSSKGIYKYNVLVADIGGTHIRFRLLKL